MRTRKKSKHFWIQIKIKTQSQKLWHTVKAVLRGKFIAILAYYLLKTEKSQKQPNLTSTRTGGTTINKAQSQWKEGNNQDQSRFN